MSGDQAAQAERAVALVEQTIRGLGIDPGASRSQREGHVAYALRRGSARILVAVHAPSDGLPEGRLRVVAPVIHLPAADREHALFRRLLELNATELVGSAFAISGGEVVVVTERAVSDLDASEVDAMIRNVGRVADRWDDQLAERFGATRSTDA
ncbi:MAG TPA: YbjN domain-containing protein [Sandaracinaceae bacterium LLY-WYZ-13_1]|nr:YbjN domain-containing protein [Sandaracinaceae bacterium LLY-WYZ-13_1]